MFVFAIIGIAGIILYSVYGGNPPIIETVLNPALGYIPPPAENPVVNDNESYSPPVQHYVPASVSHENVNYSAIANKPHKQLYLT